MKIKNKKHPLFRGAFAGKRTYEIGGVKYIVSSRFAPFDFKEDETPSLGDRIEKYLRDDLTDLPNVPEPSIISSEYVCSVAGEEEE